MCCLMKEHEGASRSVEALTSAREAHQPCGLSLYHLSTHLSPNGFFFITAWNPSICDHNNISPRKTRAAPWILDPPRKMDGGRQLFSYAPFPRPRSAMGGDTSGARASPRHPHWSARRDG